MRRSILLLSIVPSLVLSGCIGGKPHRDPPIFSIDTVRTYFEEEWIVVNVTVTNRANGTPYDPWIEFGLSEYIPKTKFDHHGDDLQTVAIHNLRLDIFTYNVSKPQPWQPRWYVNNSRLPSYRAVEFYEDHVTTGPRSIQPNESVTFEIAFKPIYHYADTQGLYRAGLVAKAFPSETSFSGGCFNYNTPEFYGVRDPRPDCPIWDSSGRDTHTEYVLHS
jgi:hypothetical protein